MANSGRPVAGQQCVQRPQRTADCTAGSLPEVSSEPRSAARLSEPQHRALRAGREQQALQGASGDRTHCAQRNGLDSW